MATEGNGFWSTVPGILTGLAGVIAAITGLYLAFRPAPPPTILLPSPPASAPGPVAAHDPPPKPMMGPLQRGWNFDHNDIDAGGWVSLTSAEACSDLCYSRADCKAMTYVVSNKSCWLKYAAPTPTPNPDMISAVKN